MLKKFFALGFGASAIVAVNSTFAQTIPPALANNPDFIVHQIGSSSGGGGSGGGSSNDNPQKETKSLDGASEASNSASAGNPANTPVQTTRASIMRTTARLRTMGVSAGADSKSVVTPDAPADRALTLYTDFDWTSTQDNRGFELDGNKFAPRIGGDIIVGPDILLGGSFTYSYSKRTSANSPITDSNSSFIFNAYAGKTFMDLINVGLTGTYAYEHQITKSFGNSFYGQNNVFSISPFIGVAKTFGPWSVASTAVYIYQYNDLDVDDTSGAGGFGDIDSHFYMQMNEVEYAVNDKFTVGALLNVNVVIDEGQNRVTALTGSTDDFWITLGAKASYQIFENITSSVEFQADLANSDYDNYLTSFGMTWSF